MKITKILFYEGHIRNWKWLCEELDIPLTTDRRQRQLQIVTCGYQKWGCDLPKHLLGMFSFAIQVDNTTVFGARDHFGVKPFYYFQAGEQLLLSSKIYDLIDHEAYKRKLDPVVLQHYLSYTYVPGRNTLFQGIKKLMPGEFLLSNGDGVQVQRYWTPQYQINPDRSLAQWTTLLSDTIALVMSEIIEPDEEENSIVMLSEGVDSSYILAASNIKQSCTVGFYENNYDESNTAKVNAQLLGRENYTRKISKEEFLAHTREAIKTLGLPIGTPATVAYSLGCQLAAEHADIFLSGEGADEFFCGYDIYKSLEDFPDGICGHYIGKADIMDETLKRSILNQYIAQVSPVDAIREFYASEEDLDPVVQMSNIDIRVWLEGNSFLNVQRMSQAYGLEARLPIVDVRIFELVAQMPSSYKVCETENKIVLRRCARKLLPPQICQKEKRGFVIPMRYWLLSGVYEQEVRSTFDRPAAKKIFNNKKLHELYDSYKAGALDLWKILWNVYVFLLWYEIFFL